METITERALIDVATGMLARKHDLNIGTSKRRLRNDATRAQMSDAQMAWELILDHLVRLGRWQGFGKR